MAVTKSAPGKSVNEPITQLLVPFEDSVITTRLMNPKKEVSESNPEITSVAPEHYRKRLLEVLGEFDLECVETVEGKTGVKGYFQFFKEGLGHRRVAVFEPWTFAFDMVWNEETRKMDKPNPKAGSVVNAEYTYAMLDSAAIKAISRNLGLGLHLYLDKAPRGTTSIKATTATAPAAAPVSKSASPAPGNYDPSWDGSEFCEIGKHKGTGTRWGDEDEVDAGYLAFITKDPAKANKKALKEIARRQHEAGSTSAASAQAAMQEVDDQSIPF